MIFFHTHLGGTMRTFSCIDCGLAITVPEIKLGQDITCPGCKTQQIVPQDAGPAPEAPPAPPPPDYVLAWFTGALLLLGGVIAICTGAYDLTMHYMRYNMYSYPNVGYALILAGLTTTVVGLTLFWVRRIARQTYRARSDR
jgi:hypothetical protein